MGDNFLKRQVRNFQKGRDLATAEMSEPTLFTRPEVVNTVYTARPGENCQFSNGEILFVVASENGRSAVLARGHQSVGQIEGDGAKALLAALNDTGAAGVAQVRITEVSGLSGVAKAVIAKDQ
ncbi:MAG: hypothetical protein HY000_38310 [Planctomycetes bacterium]|nr:hypothetical protein [Planctomycetota bacterium]